VFRLLITAKGTAHPAVPFFILQYN
jgi:hypothetical protein